MNDEMTVEEWAQNVEDAFAEVHCRSESLPNKYLFVIYRMNVVRLSEKVADNGMRQPFLPQNLILEIWKKGVTRRGKSQNYLWLVYASRDS